jgi:hypothetical protein
MGTNLKIWPDTAYEKGKLTKELRNSIGLVYVVLWIGAVVLAASGFQLGMALHVALPWIGLLLVLLFPRDFTLLKNLSSAPVGLALGWLIMSPASFGLPVYIGFVGPDSRFLRFGLGLGGILAAILLATPELEKRKLSYLVHVAQLLSMSLLYGYVAVKEVDVLFDRSQQVIYQSKVIDEKAFRPYGSPRTLSIEPWGPVGAEAYASILLSARRFTTGDPICMVLRAGALGVPWYVAERCPARTDR